MTDQTASSVDPAIEPYVRSLEAMKSYFERTISVFNEGDSAFAPKPEMFTVAGQVAHTAQTIDWFVEGAFRPEGFSMDFAALDARVRAVGSLEEARAWLTRAVVNAKQVIGSKTRDELMAPLPAGPIMGGVPRVQIISAMSDHTAHHRGALSAYARLLDRVPPMPYA